MSTDPNKADVGVLAIIRLRQAPPRELLDALVSGGIAQVEVTLNTPQALETLHRWRALSPARIGAGTVRTAAEALEAISAGAQFLVTPIFDEGVLEAAAPAGRPVYCGASTPTEIERAHRHPAVAAVKVFPAGPLGGVDYLQEISEPLDDVALLPTGGVEPRDVAAYAALGCVGVGVAGDVANDDLVAERAWGEITDRAGALQRAWQDGLGQRP